MTTNLKVKIKNVYGNELVYPACLTSTRLARLVGQKTFSQSIISSLKELGYEFEVISPSLCIIEVVKNPEYQAALS